MTVSMNLHDCAAKEKWRAALAAQVAEYERKHGQVKTTRHSAARLIPASIWSSTPRAWTRQDGGRQAQRAQCRQVVAGSGQAGPRTPDNGHHAEPRISKSWASKSGYCAGNAGIARPASAIFNSKSRSATSGCGRFFGRRLEIVRKQGCQQEMTDRIHKSFETWAGSSAD